MRRLSIVCAWVAAAGCVAAGCSQKKGDVVGVGPWKLGQTTLSEAPGICSRDEVTFCSHNGAVPIAGQAAEVNLYFAGNHDDALLVEIELTVRRCEHEAVGGALVGQLGEPSDQRDARMYWSKPRMHVTAKLPDEGRQCLVHFVAPTDRKRITDLASE